jgi:hypothetical protein
MGPNDLLSELVSSLQEESEALAAGDVERLGAASRRKGALLARLSPQLRQVGRGDSALDRVQLRQAQLLNAFNAQLLATRMLANGGRLEALLHAAGGNSMYDAGGAVAPAAQSLRPRASA